MKKTLLILLVLISCYTNAQTHNFGGRVKIGDTQETTTLDSLLVIGSDRFVKHVKWSSLYNKIFGNRGFVDLTSNQTISGVKKFFQIEFTSGSQNEGIIGYDVLGDDFSMSLEDGRIVAGYSTSTDTFFYGGELGNSVIELTDNNVTFNKFVSFEDAEFNDEVVFTAQALFENIVDVSGKLNVNNDVDVNSTNLIRFGDYNNASEGQSIVIDNVNAYIDLLGTPRILNSLQLKGEVVGLEGEVSFFDYDNFNVTSNALSLTAIDSVKIQAGDAAGSPNIALNSTSITSNITNAQIDTAGNTSLITKGYTNSFAKKDSANTFTQPNYFTSANFTEVISDIVYSNSEIVLHHTTSGNNGQIRANNLTDTRLYDLPNKSGTIAMLSDVNSPSNLPSNVAYKDSNNQFSFLQSFNQGIGVNGFSVFGSDVQFDNAIGVDGAATFNGAVTAAGNITATNFIGDGSQLTNLPIPALPSNLAYSNIDNAFTGIQTFNAGLRVVDNVFLRIGSNDDLRLLHDGSNNFIDNYTNNLFIRNMFDGGDTYFQAEDNSGVAQTLIKLKGTEGTVSLAFGNDDKLVTSSNGIDITGTVTASNFIGNWNGETKAQLLTDVAFTNVQNQFTVPQEFNGNNPIKLTKSSNANISMSFEGSSINKYFGVTNGTLYFSDRGILNSGHEIYHEGNLTNVAKTNVNNNFTASQTINGGVTATSYGEFGNVTVKNNILEFDRDGTAYLDNPVGTSSSLSVRLGASHTSIANFNQSNVNFYKDIYVGGGNLIKSVTSGAAGGYQLQRSGYDTWQFRHLDGALTFYNHTNSNKVLQLTNTDATFNADVNVDGTVKATNIYGTGKLDGHTLTLGRSTTNYIKTDQVGGQLAFVTNGNILSQYAFILKTNGDGEFKNDLLVDGTSEAASFVKTGGTASEFLKADGSVDSKEYAEKGKYLFQEFDGTGAVAGVATVDITAETVSFTNLSIDYKIESVTADRVFLIGNSVNIIAGLGITITGTTTIPTSGLWLIRTGTNTYVGVG